MKVEVEERVIDFDVLKRECFWRHEYSNNWCGITHKKCSVYKCPFVKRIIVPELLSCL